MRIINSGGIVIMTHYFDDLSVLVKAILLILLGGIISPVYRILRYLETKNIVTLVVGIVCLVTGVGNFILGLVDLVCVLTKGKITVFAE